MSIPEIYDWTVNFMQDMSPKRFEENIKFVFKLGFKKLKNKIFKKNRISFYSKKFDCQFYDYYFLKLSQKLNIGIDQFYDPLNNKNGPKTLNHDYIKLIFKSQEFKQDFLEYLESGLLLKEYQATVKRKIRQLLLKFDNIFASSDPEIINQGIRAIQKYFRKNKQCKLPWVDSEINTAIRTFAFMVNSFEG